MRTLFTIENAPVFNKPVCVEKLPFVLNRLLFDFDEDGVGKQKSNTAKRFSVGNENQSIVDADIPIIWLRWKLSKAGNSLIIQSRFTDSSGRLSRIIDENSERHSRIWWSWRNADKWGRSFNWGSHEPSAFGVDDGPKLALYRLQRLTGQKNSSPGNNDQNEARTPSNSIHPVFPEWQRRQLCDPDGAWFILFGWTLSVALISIGLGWINDRHRFGWLFLLIGIEDFPSCAVLQ